jgi:hypothetical protein
MRSRLREAERAAAAAAESASRKDGECAALRARLYAKEDQLRVREGTLQRGGGVFRGLKFWVKGLEFGVQGLEFWVQG